MMSVTVNKLLILFFFIFSASSGYASHGVTIGDELKYPEGFTHFDYASLNAGKGGRLVLHSLGSFDKMNPFTLKGVAPYGLEMLVYEPLAVASLDEPFSEYGLIAKDIKLAEDRKSVTFTLNPQARFSDGTQVTAEDVAFSLKTLKGPDVHPLYPYYYRDISKIEVLDLLRVRFHFARPNRELHMIASQIPVMSKNHYQQNKAGNASALTPPVASGPYIVSKVKPGKSISYRRNPDYWAKDHPVRKGMYNFDTITVKYYKDQTVSLEAFKAGEFDFISINIAKQWARDMDGTKFNTGDLVKKIVPHSNNAGMQGFLLNTRKEIFKDRRVRQALALAFDFEWTNKSLFYDQYVRSHSFFSNSYLGATAIPEGLELELLENLRDAVPPEVFTTPLVAPKTSGKGGLRKNLRAAGKLLKEAGWSIKDGKLVNGAHLPLAFEITLVQPTFERVMAPYVKNLNKLGIDVTYRTIDRALYTERLKKFDFDMIVMSYGQSLSPGNEQRNFWHSDAAQRQGSENYAGIRSEAVDYLIDRVIYANNQAELTAACKALDRVLWYGYYLVPNWFMDGHRISYHDKFLQPDTLPLYFHPLQLLMTWWTEQ